MRSIRTYLNQENGVHAFVQEFLARRGCQLHLKCPEEYEGTVLSHKGEQIGHWTNLI